MSKVRLGGTADQASHGDLMTLTKPTARERAEAFDREYSEVEPVLQVHGIYIDLLTKAIEAAAQAAREEERRMGECGRHPMACYEVRGGTDDVARDDTRGQTYYYECLACAREARAVEEAVAQWRNLTKIAVDALEIGKRGDERVDKLIAEAEARVRRECQTIAWEYARGLRQPSVNGVANDIADAIERGSSA